MRQSEYRKITQILIDLEQDNYINLCDVCAYGKDNCREKCSEGISRGLKNKMDNSDT